MNKTVKIIIGIVVLAGLIVAAYFGYNSLSEKYNKEKESSVVDNAENSQAGSDSSSQLYPAPDFTVTDREGNKVNLKDYFGKPIVVNFWASWCPPCKAEFPDFEKVYGETKDDVQFLMINMTDGQRETVKKGYDFIAENGYTMPVLYDTVNQSAANTYGIYSIPTTIFIDSNGNIITGKEGAMSESELRSGIEQITK